MDENTKYNEYDKIVGTIMSNVLAERNRVGKIVLWDFQEGQSSDRLYFHAACIVADVENEKVYINMPFIQYLKLKWKSRKVRKNLRWCNPLMARRLPNEGKTSVFIIMDFIAEFHKIGFNKFAEINEAYYGWYE